LAIAGERDLDLGLVDVIGIVWAAVPAEGLAFTSASLAFVRGGNGVEELVVSRDASAVLGRTPALAAEEFRIELAGLGTLDPLDGNPMQPVVAHVVGVGELVDATVEDLRKSR
jgi:hypothetical protein